MEMLYIRYKNRVSGPFQMKELQKQAREGQLSRFHEISSDGTIWKQARAIKELWRLPGDISNMLAADESPAEHVDQSPRTETLDPVAPTSPTGFEGLPPVKDIQWYYNSPLNGQQGPVPTATIHSLISMKQIQADTLVWNSSMPNWLEASKTPELTIYFS